MTAIALLSGCFAEPIPYPYEPNDPPGPPNLESTPHTVSDPCDGYDNDDDGDIDEECYCDAKATQGCYPGPKGTQNVGLCRLGVQACINVSVDFQLGTWGECLNAIVPRAEICGNGIDEDCDGLDLLCDPVGECSHGVSQGCYGGPAGTEGQGICHAGAQLCHEGSWGKCLGVQLPAEEVCGNGIDEDCDGYDKACGNPACTPGIVEPCYPGPETTLGVGECSAGQRVCENRGQWSDCHGAVLPSSEICDNELDDDCNSVVDDCG